MDGGLQELKSYTVSVHQLVVKDGNLNNVVNKLSRNLVHRPVKPLYDIEGGSLSLDAKVRRVIKSLT